MIFEFYSHGTFKYRVDMGVLSVAQFSLVLVDFMGLAIDNDYMLRVYSGTKLLFEYDYSV